jgi:hypothetical protein
VNKSAKVPGDGFAKRKLQNNIFDTTRITMIVLRILTGQPGFMANVIQMGINPKNTATTKLIFFSINLLTSQ